MASKRAPAGQDAEPAAKKPARRPEAKKPSAEVEKATAPIKVSSTRADGGPAKELALRPKAGRLGAVGTTHQIQTTQQPWKTITVSEIEYQQLLAQGLVYSGSPVTPAADFYDNILADKVANGSAFPAALGTEAADSGSPFGSALRAAFGSLAGDNSWFGGNDFAEAPTVNGVPISGGAGSGVAVGTLAERPAASADNVDALYVATDDAGGTLYRSDGVSWVQAAASVQAPLGEFVERVGGREETVHVTAASGAALTVDLSLGNVHDITLTANCVITIANPPAGAGSCTLLLRQDGTGGHAASFTGSVVWSTRNPALAMPAAGALMLELRTLTGGESWRVVAREEYAWTPSALNLFGWYSAKDVVGVADGGGVATVPDRSTGGAAVTQPTAALQPTLAAAGLNGRPVLVNDGTKWMNALAYSNAKNQPVTMFAVVRPDSITGTCIINHLAPIVLRRNSSKWEFGAGTLQATALDQAAIGSAYRLIAVFNGAASVLWVNGVKVLSAVDTGTGNASRDWFMTSPSTAQDWIGAVAEVGNVAGALDDAGAARLDAYLKNEWGLA